MYRDDRCAVCGDALPPDHLYCREHAAEVDDRLHEVAALVGRLSGDLARLATLLGGVAEETFDWLAETAGEDAEWPPRARAVLRTRSEDVDVDVDDEPGMVRVLVDAPLSAVLAAVASVLADDEAARFAAACAAVRGAADH